VTGTLTRSFAAQDDDRRPQRPAADRAIGGEHEQARRHQELVGDRIEHAPERRLLAPLAREIAVEDVGHGGADEDEQRDPAQPQPALQDVLPVETGDHRRHRHDAGVGQEVRHREGPRRKGSGCDRVHGSKEYRSSARVKRDARAIPIDFA
jgi:hypothetical protein